MKRIAIILGFLSLICPASAKPDDLSSPDTTPPPPCTVYPGGYRICW